MEEALDYARAKSFGDFKQPDSGDYKWADQPIADLDDLQPGDILQFCDYIATFTEVDGHWRTIERPHHSAM